MPPILMTKGLVDHEETPGLCGPGVSLERLSKIRRKTENHNEYTNDRALSQ